MTELIERGGRVHKVEIPDGTAVSPLVGLGGIVIAGIIVPTGFTTVGAATFETRTPTGEWMPINDEAGAPLTVSLVAGQTIPMPPEVTIFDNVRITLAGNSTAPNNVLYFSLKG